jgi:homoserine kinase
MFDDTKSEVVNRGRTVNKMTKRKRTKGQTMFYKPLYRILKIVQQETHKKPRVNSGVPEGLGSSCSSGDTLRVHVKRHEQHVLWKSCSFKK